uniref:Uncharacterized protein n=1 Tax=Biomphalaria glabrata TaxID=6526 RepID=A0A2C9LBM6_BIOGL
MIYDYFFTISSSLFDIQTVHIELNVTPKDCISYIDYEEVETITRQYLLTEVLMANSQICSAHLENSGNTGVVSFKCCHIDESSNETVCDDIKENVIWLTGVNIAAIIASTLILGLIFILILLSPTGTEDFVFYPKNMVIDFKRSNDTNNTDIRVPIYGKVIEFKSIMELTDQSGVSKIESIKLLLTKRHCVDESYSAITLLRCIGEFITDISSSYC